MRHQVLREMLLVRLLSFCILQFNLVVDLKNPLQLRIPLQVHLLFIHRWHLSSPISCISTRNHVHTLVDARVN